VDRHDGAASLTRAGVTEREGTLSALADDQPLEGLRAANDVRSRRARSKRMLKEGTGTLQSALRMHCWRNAYVLEVLGYAACGQVFTNLYEKPAGLGVARPPRTAGRIALMVAQEAGIDHWTVCAERTDVQVQAACRTLSRIGVRATCAPRAAA
jgi:hypothetical protein